MDRIPQLRASLKQILTQHLGPIDESIRQEIDSVEDTARLEELIILAVTSNSFQQFKVSGAAAEE